MFYAERPDTSSPFGAPVVWTEFDTVGTATGVFSFTLASSGDEAFLAAGFAAAGGQEIMSTRRALFYGSGCGAPPLALACNTPVLGASWDFTTTNIDPVSPIAVTFFGNVPAAIPLAASGAPGCFANIDTLAGSLTAANVGGTASAGFLLPATPSLAGASAVAQSVCLTVSNALGVLTSNGVQGTLGL